MKKKKSDVANFLNEKRFAQSLKKTRKSNRATRPELSPYQLKHLSQKHFREFNRFAIKEIGDSELNLSKISVPKKFSFGTDFNDTIIFFRKLNHILYKKNSRITIDFAKCSKMNIGAATYLQITLLEYLGFTDRINSNQYGRVNNQIKILNSKSLRVNKILFSLGIIEEFDGMDDTGESSFYPLGLITGTKSRSSYKENNKGKIGYKILNFINSSLSVFDLELDKQGENSMLNLLGEILGNAEDHSKLNKFYVNGVSYVEDDNDKSIVELNLAIINLGYSFYEGFIDAKDENKEVNKQMEQLYNHHINIKNFDTKHHSKESLFTLYGLQEGISRLKYKNESRGNGTMNFIRAFMSLGKLGEENPKYQSKLSIISGRTVIGCTNEFQPYEDGKFYRLSLNKERDLKCLPSKSSIFTYDKNFPGTILQVRVFMSREYFMKVIENEN